MPQTPDTKQDGPHGMKHADGEIARAYERIRSADEELARLDAVLSRLERGSGPRPGPRGDWHILRGVVGLLLAACIFAAAFASRYGIEAKAIIARWTPQAAMLPPEPSELRDMARAPLIQVADADAAPSQLAPSGQKTSEQFASSPASISADISSDLAQSLKSIAQDLAGMHGELEQLKARHEQTLRDHADAIQQLTAALEQSARDNTRSAEQVQALLKQLAAVSANSSGQSSTAQTSAAAR
jgi:hypothetical protein